MQKMPKTEDLKAIGRADYKLVRRLWMLDRILELIGEERWSQEGLDMIDV